MSSGTQTTEVLLRWKYVRPAVGWALYTLEQFTISEARIFRYITNTGRGTKTKTSYFTRQNINAVDLNSELALAPKLNWTGLSLIDPRDKIVL